MTENNNGIDQFASHDVELNELQELKETLTELQDRLNKISLRAHLLNIDLVTQYNPHTMETLNKTISECKKCSEQK